MTDLDSFECNITKTKDKVEVVLKNNHVSRDDDITLLFLYWIKYNNLTPEKFNKIYELSKTNYAKILDLSSLKLSAPSTISRVRRIIQNEERNYEPSSEAKYRRINLQENWKELYRERKE